MRDNAKINKTRRGIAKDHLSAEIAGNANVGKSSSFYVPQQKLNFYALGVKAGAFIYVRRHILILAARAVPAACGLRSTAVFDEPERAGSR